MDQGDLGVQCYLMHRMDLEDREDLEDLGHH